MKVSGYITNVNRTRTGFILTCRWANGCETEGDFTVPLAGCEFFCRDRFTADEVPRPHIQGQDWGGVTLTNIKLKEV